MRSAADLRATVRPWTIGFAMALALAAVEVGLVVVAYRDLGVRDPGRFLLFYGAAIAAVAATAIAIGGTLMASLLGKERRALALALGAAMAAFLLLPIRLRMMVQTADTEFANVALRSTAATLLGAGLAASGAYLLARSGIGTLRGGLLTTAACALIALASFHTRAIDYTPPTLLRRNSTKPVQSPLARENTNVVLITIDTLRADHLPTYGYPRDTAPTLKRLGRSGVVFENAMSQRSNTESSLATLLTGTYPATHRVFSSRYYLQDFNETLSELLLNSGYYTVAALCSGLFYVLNYNQGFLEREFTPMHRHQTSLILTERILPILARVEDRRFFLWVHYDGPHSPYLPHEGYRRLYAADGLVSPYASPPPAAARARAFGPAADEDFHDHQELDFAISQYDAEIRFNDDSIALLFDKLTEHGLWNESLVIVTADHGESLGEHRRYFEHKTVYQPDIHVPLIFHHPDLPAGLRVDQPVSLVDVFPTVLELLGLPSEPAIQGRSFAGLLLGEPHAPPKTYHFSTAGHIYGYQTHAVRSGRYKLIFAVDERWLPVDALLERALHWWLPGEVYSVYRARRIDRELYDLREDPGESRNLYGRHPDLEAELSEQFWNWIATTHDAGRERRIIRLTRDLKTESLRVVDGPAD